MQDLNVAIIQTDLYWEDISANLNMFDRKIASIKDAVDLIVLPEMFNTAFSMNPSGCAEVMEGRTMQWMKKKAEEKNCVITGSLLIKENNENYNRSVWMNPDGTSSCYDKKHLFRFAGENDVFSAGTKKVINSIKDWKCCPMVCYDLRFPVWSMNTYHNKTFAYDCLVYVANWPEKRSNMWKSLLVARAIENQAYVIGVNRVGVDGKGNAHSGDSMIVSPMGNIIKQIPANQEAIEIATLSYAEVQSYRTHFPVALDWDKFEIE